MWHKAGSEVAQFMIWQGWSFLEVRKQAVLIPVKNYTGVQMDDVLIENHKQGRKHTESTI